MRELTKQNSYTVDGKISTDADRDILVDPDKIIKI